MASLRSMQRAVRLDIEVLYDTGSGDITFKDSLLVDKHRFRFSSYLGFNNENPPEFMVLNDGEFIRSIFVKKVRIKRFKECECGECQDQYEDYLS